MVKKSKKKEDETNEVVANCDNLRSLKFYPSLPYAKKHEGLAPVSYLNS